MFCPVADDHLGGPVIEVIVRRQFVRDRLTQLRDAGAGRVFCEASLERFDRRLFDVLGGVKIRFTGAEAAHVDAFGLHGLGLAVNRERERRS